MQELVLHGNVTGLFNFMSVNSDSDGYEQGMGVGC